MIGTRSAGSTCEPPLHSGGCGLSYHLQTGVHIKSSSSPQGPGQSHWAGRAPKGILNVGLPSALLCRLFETATA